MDSDDRAIDLIAAIIDRARRDAPGDHDARRWLAGLEEIGRAHLARRAVVAMSPEVGPRLASGPASGPSG